MKNFIRRQRLNEHGYDEKFGYSGKSTHVFYDKPRLWRIRPLNTLACWLPEAAWVIVEAIQKYRQYEDADPKIRDLMDKLRKFEEHNMEKLKDFLWKSYSAKLPALADIA